MCCTLKPAELSATLLLGHSVEVDGVTYNVLGYQNKAKNVSRSPNAMILPIPSADFMTPENCIDMTEAPRVLRAYAKYFLPRGERSMMKGRLLGAPDVRVFDSGSYTVVLAADAGDIMGALERVPENRRPAPHPEIFEAYRLWYPGWTVALCCWDGTIEAEPILWWYRPLPEFRDKYFLPGLDGHNGLVPDPAKKSVPVDHTIIVGCDPGCGADASRELNNISPSIAKWLPSHICGMELQKRQLTNGDWVIDRQGLTQTSFSKQMSNPRAKPPGFVGV